MENRKYLDKVVDHLLRGTKIDYEKEVVYLDYINSYPPFLFPPSFTLFFSFVRSPFLVSSYCKNTFGLTEDEMEYVWEEYRNIMLDNGK